MSTLNDLHPAGGSGKSIKLVASGALSNGDRVVLQSDGTVKVVGIFSTQINENIPAGSEYVFHAAQTNEPAIGFDPNNSNKFVIVYIDQDNSYYGTAVVGTITGTTISFGSDYIFSSTYSEYTSIVFDPNTAGKFVITYMGPSNYGTAVIGTVSGTTISFGSAAVFNSGTTEYIGMSIDPNNSDKFVVVYRDGGNSNYGTAVIGTVSGTTISFGSEYVFNSATIWVYDKSVAFDPNTAGKFVIVYRDDGNSNYGTSIVGTVSGTTITYGSEYVFNSATITYGELDFDPNTAGKFVVTYKDSGNSNYGTGIIGTVSGTTITYGSEYVFNSGSASYYMSAPAFDPNTTNKFIIAYKDDVAGTNNVIVGTVSGTTISFGSEYVISTGGATGNSVAFDPNNSGKFVVVYRDDGNSSYGTSIIGQIATTANVTNLTATSFLGTSEGAFSDTDTATVMLRGGITTTQSGLTIGSKYYVQTDGTLSTTAGDPSVIAGQALSATTLLIEGET